MSHEKYFGTILKLNGKEMDIIYNILFDIFKFDEVESHVQTILTETEENCEITNLKSINASLEAELQTIQTKNNQYERMIPEIKSENNKIITLLKDRIIKLEEENMELKSGKGLEDYIIKLNELSILLEEEKTRSNSLLSFNKLESEQQSNNSSFKPDIIEDVKQLKEEIVKLTRQNIILEEKYLEKSSADSEELNYID
jgi:hypothetical protein